METKKNKKTFDLKEYHKYKGITMVSLVITMVVLMILATVSMQSVIGENGILRQTQEVRKLQNNKLAEEEEAMNALIMQYDEMQAQATE